MPRKLLVVDDSSTIAEAVRHALTGEDWTVTVADSTTKAVETLQEEAPDAVLCDVMLGEEDGYEACRILRAALPGTEVPVILMGGVVSESLAALAGAAAVLTKPFQSDELVDTLEYSLQEAGGEAGREDLFCLERASPREAGPGTSPADPPEEQEVEIIDLSEDDEFADLDWIEDLEPLPSQGEQGRGTPAPAFDPPGGGEPAPGAGLFGREEWSRVDSIQEFGARAPELGGSAPDAFGSIELDFPEFAQSPGLETSSGPEEENATGVEARAGDLTREAVFETRAETGSGSDREPDELLGDIDLEGWVEERHGFEQAEETEPEGPSPQGKTPSGTGGGMPADEAAPEEEGWILEEPASGERSGLGFESPPLPLGESPAPVSWDTEPSGAEDLSEPWPPPVREEEQAGPEAHPPWTVAETPPSSGVPWDLDTAKPEPFAAEVAGTAAEAVRRALEESLSPDRLTPLLTATVERVVREVVPPLAERLIRDAIEKLQGEPPEGAE